MTDLEMMKRARLYLDKLSNGINPLDDTEIPDGDIVNNVRISRCLFYVSGVLQRTIAREERGGKKGAEKIPFAMTDEERTGFAFSAQPVSASELAKRLNDAAKTKNMKRMTYAYITSWLVETGLLTAVRLSDGKEVRRPTPDGNNVGITEEQRTGQNGAYMVTVYDETAQRFILDHLDDITGWEKNCAAMQGLPWTQEQDAKLEEWYRQGLPANEAARMLKRNVSAVQSRIKKLGLRKSGGLQTDQTGAERSPGSA